MKVVIIACVLFAYALAADEWKPFSEEEHLKIRKQCLEDLKVPTEISEKALKYEFDDSSEALHCAIKCVMEKNGVFNAESGFDVDRIYEQALFKGTGVSSKDDLKSCITTKEKDEDDCTWAYRTFKCALDHKYLIPKKP